MSRIIQHRCKPLLCLTVILLFILFIFAQPRAAKAATRPLLVLDRYSITMNVGDTTRITCFSNCFSLPDFSSSKPSVASVDAFGRITAKKSGSTIITAKIKGTKAKCLVTVNKTRIYLSSNSVALERNERIQLTIRTSTLTQVTCKSSRPSVATVTDDGIITGGKPGSTTITVKADDTTVTCAVTVKKPTITLASTRMTLKPQARRRLQAKVSSCVRPKWTSSHPSIVSVDEFGVITAKKAGSATVTASVDGVRATCKITVKP